MIHNTGHYEWYTPPYLIDVARRVMGEIDLDPASSEVANRTVGAKVYYDRDTDGLHRRWVADTLWLNPPYSMPLIYHFAIKLQKSIKYKWVKEAICLVNNSTETVWFQEITKQASAICLLSGRIRFVSPDGSMGKTPLQGQALIYIGGRPEHFATHVSVLGRVWFSRRD